MNEEEKDGYKISLISKEKAIINFKDIMAFQYGNPEESEAAAECLEKAAWVTLTDKQKRDKNDGV